MQENKFNKMRNILFILGLSLSLQIATAQSDEELITQTVNDYLEGGTNGEVERFKKAFLSDAIQKSVGKTGVTGMTVESLASKIKPNQKMERTTKIVSWSYAGTAATAVTETEYPTSKIIDLLNLLKVNNEWKIVSRVYSRVEKEEFVTSSSPTLAKADPKAKGKTAAGTTPIKKKAVANDGW
ncbi:Putative lumazine-binding [Spirosomataceae bacterium]